MAVTESVKIVFEVDDKALVSTVAQLQAVGKVSQEDAAKFNALTAASKAAGASLEGASKGAEKFAVASKDVAKSTTEVAKSAGELKTVAPSLGQAGQSAEAAGEGFVSLRTRLREAKLELQQLEEQFGPFSAEANAARQRAGELADEFADLNRQVNLTNPEGKVQAFQKLGQGIVGAFSVATGALQAFGAENEQVQAIASKLQGALNIAQGVQSIVGLKEAYEDVKSVLGFTTAAQTTLTTATTAGTVATEGAAVATRGFAAALTSTGIGAIVVAIGALVGAFLLYNSSTEEAKANEEALKAAQDASKTSTDNLKDATDRLAVARGQKTQEQVDKENALAASLKRQEELNKTLGDAISEQLNAQEKVNELSGGAAPKLREERELRLENAKAAVAQAAGAIQAEKDALAATNAYIDLNKQQKDGADAAANAEREANERKQRRIQLLDQELAALAEAQRGALIGVDDEIQRIAITDSFREQITAKQIERAKVAGESITLIEQKAANDQLQSFEDLFAAVEAARDKDVEDAKRAAKEKLDDAKQAIQEELKIDKLDNLIAFQQQSIALNKELNQKNNESDKDYAKRKEQILRELDRIERELRIANLKSEVDAQDKKLKKLKEAGKEGTTEYKEAAKEQEVTSNQLTEAVIDNANITAEAQTDAAKTTQKETISLNRETLGTFVEGTKEAFDLIADIQREKRQREIDELDDQREKGLITEEQYQEKLAAIKRKQAVADKNAAIFNATLQFSQALINALTTTPATAAPAALIFAAAIAGANLAKIIATPLPKFKHGTLAVPGYDTGDDSVHAMLRPGEAVIPTEINREYASAIKAIYTRKVSSKELNEFVESRSRMTVVQDEPVFNFNPVTMDALFKRDLRVSRISSAVDRASGGIMPTINVKADVDTYALGKVISKNKSMEVTNVESIGEAVAEALSKRTNRRQQI